MSSLTEIRQRIDNLDEQIQRLINERAALAQTVAQLKNEVREEPDYYRPEREAEILRRVLERNDGPLENEVVARLFREIMSACLALEQPLNIAYLGPEGTFTQTAALKHFGHAVETLPCAAIDEVFRDVEAKDAHYGVVPVENSTEGVVNHTLDMFLSSTLRICGEVQLRIHHHLLSKAERVGDISKIYAHQQALAQCREWLNHVAGQVELIAVSSNAEAARMAADEEDAAAIAGDTAAEIYGLNILASNIEDEPDNTTRFLVIGHQIVPPTGNDKTSLLLFTSNRPGALVRLLKPIAEHGISMTRIESRPSRSGLWDYVFFIDIEGHEKEDEIASVLSELDKEAAMLKILGSYPCAVL